MARTWVLWQKRIAGVVVMALLLVFTRSSRPATSPTLQASRPQFRALWVDAFNSGFKSPSEVDALIANAQRANINALLIQVRRRADAYYLNSLEPLTEDAAFARNFDALQYTIERAHPLGIEVHVFAAVMAIWQASWAPPTSPNHVLNRHGPNSPDSWVTFNSAGSEFASGRIFIDPGHPAAADYTVNALLHIVENYDIDGLHLDIIRYPEGGDWGYNPVNLARFNTRYLRTGRPAPNDPQFSEWRREQVTALVRKLYLRAIALKPHVKISMAAIPWGAPPGQESDWLRSAAYSQVYQDWRSWLEQGIIDMAIVMNYSREHCDLHRDWFNGWLEWDKNHKYDRHVIIGLGAYLNSLSNTIAQTRRALEMPSSQGQTADGIAFYSYANNENTLPTGCSGSVPTFNPAFFPALSQLPGFAEPVSPPEMSWKTNPTKGYMMGVVTLADGTKLDGGTIILERIEMNQPILVARASSDGSGFYGFLGLDPGSYRVSIMQDESTIYTSETIQVTAGRVAEWDVMLK